MQESQLDSGRLFDARGNFRVSCRRQSFLVALQRNPLIMKA